jgi:hypothetical protein
VAGHRGDEQAVHRSFRGLEELSRFGAIEAASPRRGRQLVMERRSESKESLDGLAER